MTQTLGIVVLFVGAMAMLPWLVRRLQQHRTAGAASANTASKVMSAVAIGPQQRVVTVEVGPDHARTWLVLGVTAQNVSCLHVLPAAPVPSGVVMPATESAFAREMAAAVREPGAPPHV
jgi:flagellar protein FliO/FliZ